MGAAGEMLVGSNIHGAVMGVRQPSLADELACMYRTGVDGARDGTHGARRVRPGGQASGVRVTWVCRTSASLSCAWPGRLGLAGQWALVSRLV